MSRTTTRFASGAMAAAATVALLVGCASTPGAPAPADSPSADAGFPVTITGALGSTTIESAPTRVATWGWGATDAVIALGVTPVAIPSDDYSGGEDKIAPWVSEGLQKLGGEAPVILDGSASTLSTEELLTATPDVLLAPYSGLTQEEFDEVSGAGVPVVAYPEAVWTTPWRDAVKLVGEALGKAAEADRILADMDALVADAAAAHPEFEGTSIALLTESAGTYYLYLPADPRVEILEDLGFVTPKGVTALDTGEGTFYTTVSPEKLDEIDADVVLAFGETQDAFDTFASSDNARLIPAISKGAVAGLIGPEEISMLSPTPLTLPYGLDTIVEKLAAATAVAKG
ncbi:ABC transporter substrate-binding protein [Microbacterium sp.]|uniref:ABC transporter substrate-binding protein n=1 Tax=Microbacterium sp. TaxID=51671 RepID=UPI0039E4A885